MNDLQKYEAVNACETLEELANVIKSFAGKDFKIEGRNRKFSAESMAEAALDFKTYYDTGYANVLTRKWGIRQQAMYILYYTESN